MKYNIPFIRPIFPDKNDLITDYQKIIDSNWYTNFGPYEREFSQKLAKYIGEGFYAATFSNATLGIIASIFTILGKGDNSRYIIIPSFTFAAGAEAIVWCGYKPLFVDIELPDLQLSLQKTKEACDKYQGNISAILLCNAFGVGTNNISDWEDYAEAAKIPLIIDSAAGFGSKYNDVAKVGSAGTCEIFSFHATKPFSIGEGGAVVSRDKTLVNNLVKMQNFGFDETKQTTSLGFNAKLQEINAAIGLRQLENFDKRLTDRRRVLKRYKEELSGTGLIFQTNSEKASLCFATVLCLTQNDRDYFYEKLNTSGVEVKKYYYPSLQKHEYFKNTEVYLDLKNTNIADDLVLSLPVHDSMTDEEVDLVIEGFKK